MLEKAAALAGDLCQLLALAVLLIRPLRERLLGLEALREGQRSLLRSQVVGLYYRRLDRRGLHPYEYKNLEHCYRAYKALGGNSFVDHLYETMRSWEIL
jgi:hypothetical protein